MPDGWGETNESLTHGAKLSISRSNILPAQSDCNATTREIREGQIIVFSTIKLRVEIYVWHCINIETLERKPIVSSFVYHIRMYIWT